MTEHQKMKEGNERIRSTAPQRPNFIKGWVMGAFGKAGSRKVVIVIV